MPATIQKKVLQVQLSFDENTYNFIWFLHTQLTQNRMDVWFDISDIDSSWNWSLSVCEELFGFEIRRDGLFLTCIKWFYFMKRSPHFFTEICILQITFIAHFTKPILQKEHNLLLVELTSLWFISHWFLSSELASQSDATNGRSKDAILRQEDHRSMPKVDLEISASFVQSQD